MNLTPREKNLIRSFVAVLVFVVSFFVYQMRHHKSEEEPLHFYEDNHLEDALEDAAQKQDLSESETKAIYVDIDGAVQNPGLYELDAGSRVKDAIVVAGGIVGEADMRLVNQARKLSDEEKLYIPHVGENSPNAEEPSETGSGTVSIQNASKEELMKLPGVGEKTADKIIEHRNAHPFSKVEDLKEVPGIGEKTFESLQSHITL